MIGVITLVSEWCWCGLSSILLKMTHRTNGQRCTLFRGECSTLKKTKKQFWWTVRYPSRNGPRVCVICIGNLWEFFSCENVPEGCIETHKSSFFSTKQVIRRNGDHEWHRITNDFILCDLLWKVQKSHTANREGCIQWWEKTNTLPFYFFFFKSQLVFRLLH